MTQLPETRISLLLRLQDGLDRDAWSQFVEIYRPVIHRLAQRRGLQDADAEDVSQQVLWSISQALQRREHDPERARFRTWLSVVVQRAVINCLQRGPQERGSGHSDVLRLLNEQAESIPDELDLEYRREVFQWAARRIRPEFQTATWDAFWLSAVEGKDCEWVARHLGRRVGSIYTARSRVIRRLREKINEFDDSVTDFAGLPCK